jgi:signal transduction histidine kinase/ActR/RegA family two-component response regulator
MARYIRLIPTSSLSALLLLPALLPLLLFAWTVAGERDRAWAEGEHRAVRTVWALHEHAAKVLETHELVLAEVARATAGRSWASIETDSALWADLWRIAAGLDQAVFVTLADAEGRVRLTSASFPPAPDDTLAGREEFRFHQEGGRGTHIGPARAGAEPGIAVSRALHDGGRFVGVAKVVVPLSRFTDFWQRFVPTVAHVIPLIRADGVVLARSPMAAAPEPLPRADVFLASARTARESTFTGVFTTNGVERLYAFSQVKQHPLHIGFGVETRALLGEWRARMWQLGLFSLLATLALLTAAALAVRQHRTQRQAAQRWRETADRLATAMQAREQAEATLRRAQTLDALGQLTAGVAHDFNNLLQAVRGGFILLRRRREPAQAEAVIASGLQAVDRGAKLVRQLMVFARRDKLEPRPTDLGALVAGMGDLIQKAAGPGTRIEVEIEPELEPALIDATQAELAVLNLVINARDAMAGREERRLTICAHRFRALPGVTDPAIPAGAQLVLSVADTGAGMRREVADRALEPFFTTKPVGKGTGLGLSMVHGFATQSGGALRIESEPGEGTQVSLYLPAAAGVAAVPTEGAAGAAACSPGPPRTVLLVDDDALGRLMTATALREAGHRVFEARDGEDGLAMLRAHPEVEVLVTDYAMPGMNGARLAAVAREERPALLVLIITGHASETPEDLHRVAHGVLRKPFDADDLDRRLRAPLPEAALTPA